jgi:hypothetical protein
MKLAGAIGKSVVLVLAGVFIVLFLSELSSVPASGSLFEKLILPTPVVLAIRVSLIFIALGIIGLIISIFWKQISIIKIGSTGIEFGKVAEIPSRADDEITAIKAEVRNLKARNTLLIKDKNELLKRIKILESSAKGTKNE